MLDLLHESRFWRGRRVALTGATGFLGRHLVRLLLQYGAEVVALVRAGSRRNDLEAQGVSCRIAPLDDLAALTSGCAGCEVVFHLAGAVDFSDDLETMRKVNVTGSLNVLRAAKQAGVRRFIHTSSIVAVGASRRPTLLDEDTPWNLGNMGVPYAITKREGELAVLNAGDGPEVVVVNPSCIVGPDDPGPSEFGSLCRRFWKGRVPIYFSGGNNFVDVRDVAAGHLLAARRGVAGQRYLLGGDNLTYGEFFALLAEASARRRWAIRLPGRLAPWIAAVERLVARRGKRPNLPPGQARLMGLYLFFDCRRARQELGYAPRPVIQSLGDTYADWRGVRAA